MGSRGKAPVGVWGRSPPEAEAILCIKTYIYLVNAFQRRYYITSTPEMTRRHRAPPLNTPLDRPLEMQ